jgi:type IV pilus assembly protein PilY1
MYSVNYLNWKYGPRGPNGRPIARKTRMQIAKDALATLVERTNGVRYGLMVFNGLPADNTKRLTEGSQGARVVYPITRMGSSPTDTPDVANRQTLITRIFAQEAKGATPLTESVYEAMLYFSGRAPRFGTNAAISTNFGATSVAAQGGGNVADGADPTALCTGVGAQCPAVGVYKSPMLNNPTAATPASCQRNFIVLITDGGPDRDRTQTPRSRIHNGPRARRSPSPRRRLWTARNRIRQPTSSRQRLACRTAPSALRTLRSTAATSGSTNWPHS